MLKRILYFGSLLLINISFSLDFTGEYKEYFSHLENLGHFNVYCPNNERNRIKDILNTAEESYKEITRIFPNKLPSINILVFSSTEDYNRLFGWQCKAPDWAKGQYRKDMVILINPDKNRNWLKNIIEHELTHVFIIDISRNVPNWLNEGLAQYVAKDDYVYMGKSSEELMGEAFKLHNLFSLAELNQTYDNFNNDHDVKLAYREALTVTGYLVNNYGSKKIIEFIYRRKQGNELGDDLKKVFGVSYEELEKKWLISIKNKYSAIKE